MTPLPPLSEKTRVVAAPEHGDRVVVRDGDRVAVLPRVELLEDLVIAAAQRTYAALVGDLIGAFDPRRFAFESAAAFLREIPYARRSSFQQRPRIRRFAS